MTTTTSTPEWVQAATYAADQLAARWVELELAIRTPYPIERNEIRSSSGAQNHVPLNLGTMTLVQRGEDHAADLCWIAAARSGDAYPRNTDTAVKWRWLGDQLLRAPTDADARTNDKDGRRIARALASWLARVEQHLGYVQPIRHLATPCPACKHQSLIANLENWLAICTYPKCEQPETGKPYRAELPDVNALPVTYSTSTPQPL